MPRPTRKGSEHPDWKQKPEWLRQVRDVLLLKARGIQEDQINAITQIEHTVIRRIIEEEEVNNEIIRKSWNDKVPLMRDIIGMGLNGLKETLKEMANPEIRRLMIRNVNDLTSLTKIVTELNLLLRLEEGKSTANVATQHTHTYQQTREAIIELGKIDPVFEYPQLPESVNGEG